MKFAQTTSKTVLQELYQIYQHHTCFKNRQRAQAKLELKTAKTSSKDTLKRMLKKI